MTFCLERGERKGIKMELREAIQNRRSVREYSKEKVDPSLLKDLIQAACWAPSAMNRQPWFFVVVQSDEELVQLRAIMAIASQKEKDKLERVFSSHPEVAKESRAFIENLGGAATCILAFLQKEYGDQTTGMIESVSAAIQNFCLLAHEQGISTCWMTGHEKMEAEIREKFGPDKGKCIALITVGYSDQQLRPPKRHDDVCQFI
jgi:nitroreductase